MKKKILVISPIPTHPQNAGNRARVYSLLSNLREMNHDVHFLHVKKELGDDVQMRKFWGERFYSRPYDASRIRLSMRGRIKRRLTRTFLNRGIFSYGIDDWYDRSLDEFVATLSKEIDFDVVIVEYVYLSKALQSFGKNVLKIIDTHDVFTDRHKLFLQSGQRPLWYSTSAKEEAKGLNRADVIIAIQQKEKGFFSKIVKRKIITVGHTVPLYKPQSSPKCSGEKRMLFVGSTNQFNVHGINYFIKEIFPRVRDYHSSIKLMVAGKVCTKMEEVDGCILLGELDNIKDAYDDADLVINPVLFGTGQCIKTMEALGYAKPLVTTSTGSKGLEDGIDKAFLVADDPDDFAQAIIGIFSDARLYDRLSQNAHDFAKKWNEKNLGALADILN